MCGVGVVELNLSECVVELELCCVVLRVCRVGVGWG